MEEVVMAQRPELEIVVRRTVTDVLIFHIFVSPNSLYIYICLTRAVLFALGQPLKGSKKTHTNATPSDRHASQ